METTASSFPLGVIFVCAAVFLMVMFLAAGAVRIVPEEKRLKVYRLGRYLGDKGPGIVFLMPFIDKGISIDVLDQMQSARKQQVYSGAMGETLTPVHAVGSVQIGHDTWEAVSKTPIAAGEAVRIVKVLIEVERIGRPQ